jgi:hypothetical protein
LTSQPFFVSFRSSSQAEDEASSEVAAASSPEEIYEALKEIPDLPRASSTTLASSGA